MDARATPPEQAQLPLSPEIHWQEVGGMLRALLRRAVIASGVSNADLARETGIDERQIARALADDGGAHPPLALVACILWKDRGGIYVTGLAERLGYEARPKAPDLAAENRRLRELLAHATAVLEEARRA